MSKETNRREFEEWAKENHKYLDLSFNNDTDAYRLRIPQIVWEAWQAARERQTRQMQDACELIADIMRDEVNIVDECEKFLRAYAPQLLFPSKPPTSEKI